MFCVSLLLLVYWFAACLLVESQFLFGCFGWFVVSLVCRFVVFLLFCCFDVLLLCWICFFYYLFVVVLLLFRFCCLVLLLFCSFLVLLCCRLLCCCFGVLFFCGSGWLMVFFAWLNVCCFCCFVCVLSCFYRLLGLVVFVPLCLFVALVFGCCVALLFLLLICFVVVLFCCVVGLFPFYFDVLFYDVLLV